MASDGIQHPGEEVADRQGRPVGPALHSLQGRERLVDLAQGRMDEGGELRLSGLLELPEPPASLVPMPLGGVYEVACSSDIPGASRANR